MTVLEEIQSKLLPGQNLTERTMKDLGKIHLEFDRYERTIEIEENDIAISFAAGDHVVTTYRFNKAIT